MDPCSLLLDGQPHMYKKDSNLPKVQSTFTSETLGCV